MTYNNHYYSDRSTYPVSSAYSGYSTQDSSSDEANSNLPPTLDSIVRAPELDYEDWIKANHSKIDGGYNVSNFNTSDCPVYYYTAPNGAVRIQRNFLRSKESAPSQPGMPQRTSSSGTSQPSPPRIQMLWAIVKDGNSHLPYLAQLEWDTHRMQYKQRCQREWRFYKFYEVLMAEMRTDKGRRLCEAQLAGFRENYEEQYRNAQASARVRASRFLK